ncbi:MAG: ABC transporter ATP-binding protein [Clostridia bacterium]|nr:ABC transporter ATP-binding protein [Clostridia bacterium]
MLLRMRDITKDYPMGKTSLRVLNNVALDVAEGDYLAIMGPSGSGKTTLMNIIGCLDVPTAGIYELAGRDMTGLNDNQLADVRSREIGFVFQSLNLLPKTTALDNVAMPLLYAGVPKAERLERAAEALKTVGLEDRMDFKPEQLSGGQSQRVAVARAIVGNPKLLLADEPTGALDSVSGAQVMDLFTMLNEKGTTIIMITHDTSVAEHAGRIATIRDGILTGGEKDE